MKAEEELIKSHQKYILAQGKETTKKMQGLLRSVEECLEGGLFPIYLTDLRDLYQLLESLAVQHATLDHLKHALKETK